MNDESGEGRSRLAVVIGGGNGIGAATGKLLHERGWRVVFADLDEAAAQRMAKQCNGHGIADRCSRRGFDQRGGRKHRGTARTGLRHGELRGDLPTAEAS